MTMELYDYPRSSAAFRVRIALNLKDLGYRQTMVDLRAGDQRGADYRAVNPQGLVPALRHEGEVLRQSVAILEFLEERYPTPPLLPAGAVERARVRALVQAVACDIHPLNNVRVLTYLTGELGLSEDDKLRWYRHWIAEGLTALDTLVAEGRPAGAFCHGAAPSLADVCLVPQVVNAKRYECPLDDYPTLMGIFDACMALPAFERAQPSRQPGFV